VARKDIPQTVAELCAWFPETGSKVSHGSPTWTVRGKQFACFSVNHHGDGHVGLIVRSPPGEQHRLVESDPAVFYVPAYYGPSGWTGIELNGDADWQDVVTVTADAWRQVAPASLARTLETLPRIAKPRKMKPEEIDPFVGGRGRQLRELLSEICLALPEASEDAQFGAPCFRVGKKNFCTLHVRDGRFGLQARVGPDRQAMLTFDERYLVPPYTGKNGWIELDLQADPSRAEIEALVRESYRHFATKRALRALDGA
jgi:predicted DNA-binding protein (MmcQ/YjbR family)